MPVISDRNATSEALRPSSSRRARRTSSGRRLSSQASRSSIIGWVVCGGAIGLLFVGNWATLTGIVLIVIFGALLGGVFVVQPNEARVLILFGRYVGSVTEAGLWYANPFNKRKKISLRVRNFQSERIKVNDASGNPIEIAAVIVWRDHRYRQGDVRRGRLRAVRDRAERDLAPPHRRRIPVRRLRGATRSHCAATSTRSATHFKPSSGTPRSRRHRDPRDPAHPPRLRPEIAEVMLRRQQAEAILAARRTMVQGAVGLVQMALRSWPTQTWSSSIPSARRPWSRT